VTDTLFDHMARESDPDTSHQAASEDRQNLELVVLSHIRAAGWVGATAEDVHLAMCGRIAQNSVARRITSLRKAGLVELVGTRTARSGRSQKAWRSVGHLMGGAA
jgi:hypothetical protein